MNRRDVVKALATLPFASVLGSCRENRPSPGPSKSQNIHTLQVLLEGAFAVVLQKGAPNRLTAFVPRIEQERRDLAHDFFFNDPYLAKPALTKDPAGYHFQLSGEGLRTYAETYTNPGFADFTASTKKWRLSDRVVTIELPFPNSINFSGRPLHVTFASGRSGLMPTNSILEYYVDNPEKVKMLCSQMEGKCPSSPNCPPGVLRFFFAVAPQIKDNSQKHAVDFFNLMLHRSFPDLEERYRLSYIEPSEQNRGRQSASLVPAVLKAAHSYAQYREAAAVLDCQIGSFIVDTDSAPMP